MITRLRGGGGTLFNWIGRDAWAGSVKFQNIKGPSDLHKISYNHGAHADKNQSMLKSDWDLRERYWLEHAEKLRDPIYQVLEIIRTKEILLSYLQSVPKRLGFKPWAPYHEIDIALSMLTLPPERRENRIWQREFFKKNGQDLESMNLQCDRGNTLELQALRICRCKPLNVNLLREVIHPHYLEWINKKIRYSNLTAFLQKTETKVLNIPKCGRIFRTLGLKEWYTLQNEERKAHIAYTILKPIENIILKRNNAGSSQHALSFAAGLSGAQVSSR
jgi:hypothetical protein